MWHPVLYKSGTNPGVLSKTKLLWSSNGILQHWELQGMALPESWLHYIIAIVTNWAIGEGGGGKREGCSILSI